MTTYLTKSVDIDDDAETSSSFDDVSQHHLLRSKSRRKKRRSYSSSVRDAARDVYHTSLDCDQSDVSRDQSKTRARLLATCSALASMYIGYHAAPLLAEGSHQLSDVHGGTREEFHAEERRVEIEWLLERWGRTHDDDDDDGGQNASRKARWKRC